ncbi:MAG: hypothetical protein V2A58_06775 [Planctomycetota bacterium]
MAPDRSSQLPDIPRSEFERYLARIDRRLAQIEEKGGRDLTVEREIAERMLILEGQVNYHARMSRLIAVFLSLVLAVVLAVGGVIIWKLSGQIEKLVGQRVDDARQLARALGILEGLNERLKAGGGVGSLSQQDIQSLQGIVKDILGSDMNGFMKNLSIQNELLDELEGKKPRRPQPGSSSPP